MQADNLLSATRGNANYEAVKQQVLSELQDGNYVLCDSPPSLASPLGAVPKKDGGIRLIHDCSRPIAKPLNDYASIEMSHKFQTSDDATSSVQAGYYMSKVDLKSAYRSVSTNTESQQFTGLKFWFDDRFVYVRDTKLPFGSKLVPGIFHSLTQAVKRMMEKRGFTALVVYLDDVFVCAVLCTNPAGMCRGNGFFHYAFTLPMLSH